jgi:hypothetical protein
MGRRRRATRAPAARARPAAFLALVSAALAAAQGGNATCAARGTLYVTLPYWGLGNMLTVLASGAVLAAHVDKCLALVTRGARDKLALRGVSLAGLPHARVTARDVPPGVPVLSEAQFVPADGVLCPRLRTTCNAYAEAAVPAAALPGRGGSVVLARCIYAFRHEHQSTPHFDAAMTEFLRAHLQLRAVYGTLAASVYRSLPPPRTALLGVHFRRGDSCTDGRKRTAGVGCPSLGHAAAAVRREVAARAVRGLNTSVFLATDEPSAEAALRALLPVAGVTLVRCARCPAAVDLYLLSRAAHLVGTRASSFSAVAARWGGVPMVEVG